MPAPLANWNRARDAWETSHSHIDLFSELSAVFSETWPTSGMTRDGVAFPLPPLVPLMDGSVSSSSPGLLSTPQSRDYKGRPADGFNTACLVRDIEDLVMLPTPTATPYGNNQSPSPGAAVRPSLDSLAPMLLPTPTTEPMTGNGHARNLGKEVSLLPTPTVQDAGGSRNCTQPRKPGMAPATGTTLTDWLWLREGWTGASTGPPSTDGNEPSDD